MAGIVWFIFWQLSGMLLSRLLFPRCRLTVRLWLGSVVGSVLSQWVPVPVAFVLGFTAEAHLVSLVIGCILLAVCALVLRKKKDALPIPYHGSAAVDRPFLFLAIPFMILCTFLVCSHALKEVDGALYTGQCTYGDMSMHLGFISSMAVQGVFPPEYSILPGTQLCYPFLCDSISASLYLLGTSLRWAYSLPMLFALAQVFAGAWFLAAEFCRSRDAAIVAWLLFFLNGGFGTIYFFGEYSFRDLLTGFYKTPTNLVDKQIRWVNVIADMLIPQRATLFGWAVLFACLYLLYLAVFRREDRMFLPAGILGGLLPMIHTHSFFALGLMAACWLVYSAFRDEFRWKWLRGWLFFGLAAVVLAAPQLFIWTFRSVSGNAHFLRLNFDWVNHGEENWFLFWIRNVGIVFLLAPVALILAEKEQRAVFSGAVFIFVICEFLVFQPNVYDNNKLLLIGYYFGCLLTADAVFRLLAKKKTGCRIALLSLLLLLGTNAGVLTLAREAVSGIPTYGYMLFHRDEVCSAGFILEHTAPDSLFLTSDNHDNPVAVLTGRNILCGSPSYLFYHGVDYTAMQQAEKRMLTDPQYFEAERGALGVDYVYWGDHERALGGELYDHLLARYEAVFTSDRVTIFDVSKTK